MYRGRNDDIDYERRKEIAKHIGSAIHIAFGCERADRDEEVQEWQSKLSDTITNEDGELPGDELVPVAGAMLNLLHNLTEPIKEQMKEDGVWKGNETPSEVGRNAGDPR